MRDGAGGEANGAIGPEMDAQSRKRRQHQGDGGGDKPLPGSHAVLQHSRIQRDACAAPPESIDCTVTPGGGTSSSGTKKSSASGTERSTR